MITEETKKRFIEEYRQLDERINKLETYLAKVTQPGPMLDGLLTPASMLDQQLGYMLNYRSILRRRAILMGVNLDE